MEEDFKRPLHADFATSKELKDREFTGIRHNSITHAQELWTLGDLRLSVSFTDMRLDPGLWDRKYEEIFKLKHVQSLDVQ